MDKIEDIKQYLNKLLKVVKGKGEFSLFGKKLIKKEKIDDILCCLLAVFPDNYKKMVKQKQGGKVRLNSIILYNALFDAIKGKFILNNSVYMVDSKK